MLNCVFVAVFCAEGWSAPSAIGIAGLGGGFEIGLEVRSFCSKKQPIVIKNKLMVYQVYIGLIIMRRSFC